jgi:hypothetical protein
MAEPLRVQQKTPCRLVTVTGAIDFGQCAQLFHYAINCSKVRLGRQCANFDFGSNIQVGALLCTLTFKCGNGPVFVGAGLQTRPYMIPLVTVFNCKNTLLRPVVTRPDQASVGAMGAAYSSESASGWLSRA